MKQKFEFDVLVIGGGHAGIEAAHAAAKMGSQTVLITLNLDTIGMMSCNPSIGGVGKGHIVYEISALGGLMPKLCTQTCLQARMLNTRKGPAVQGLRLQIDKYAYNRLSKQMLEQLKNLSLRMGMVEEILLDKNKKVYGVRLRDGAVYQSQTVIITTGTFLRGQIHIGMAAHQAGRQGEEASVHLSSWLEHVGVKIGRLKTGTPPRLLRSSIDFSKLTYQKPDELSYLFEFFPHTVRNTHPCYIAYTNQKTHEIIRENRHLSALFNGSITGIGPRYCPSIEDKIHRFPDKEKHHVFVEPESASSDEVYPNGLSTSLPYEVQLKYIRSIEGFENAVITRLGYAVEYDFVHPQQLNATLESKEIEGLFFAGQINGTTGYEEAAGQGLIAGINAHLKHFNKESFTLDRTESYIGIMIDDLISLGVDEPYRMFTSRAEHRLTIRQDNSFSRLMPKGYKLGLVDKSLYDAFCNDQKEINQILLALYASCSKNELLQFFAEITYNKEQICRMIGKELSDRMLRTIQAEIIYEPYLKREERDIKRIKQYKMLLLPQTLNYFGMPGLSCELQEKLTRYKPTNIAQAALIPGMTPAAISLLILKVQENVQNTV
jgi:tRNA uridine 5-carboxymethylaminomethyl modification enzyme